MELAETHVISFMTASVPASRSAPLDGRSANTGAPGSLRKVCWLRHCLRHSADPFQSGRRV